MAGMPESEKQKLMSMLEEMQLKEQVTMYNSLVERCETDVCIPMTVVRMKSENDFIVHACSRLAAVLSVRYERSQSPAGRRFHVSYI
jgi:hypothetical protein